MNCNLFGEKITVIARKELLDAETKQEALNHAESCADCQGRLQSEEILSLRLKEFASDSLQVEASSKIEFALREAFALRVAKQNQTVVMMPRRKTSQRGAWVIGGAIAASILIAVGLFAQSFSSKNVNMTSVVLISEKPERVVENENIIEEDDWCDFLLMKNFDESKEFSSSYASVKPRKQTKRNSANKETRETEITTEFISLTQDDAVAQLETKQIVRVRLARSELLALGLAIDMERADEKITADVMLGEGGIAKAIRFVRTSDD